MKKIPMLLFYNLLLCIVCQAQELFADKASLVFTGTNAKLIIEGGNLSANTQIFGTVVMKSGASASLLGQNNINMNLSGSTVPGPYSISKLEIDNPNGVQLSGNAIVKDELKFTQGNIYLINANLTLKNGCDLVSAFGSNKGVVTNGTGYMEYELNTTNLGEQFHFPLAYDNPLSTILPKPTRLADIYLNNTGGTVSTGTPTLRAQVKYGGSPNRPPRTESYTTAYWPIRVSGINGGSLTGIGNYGVATSPAVPSFVGNENEMVGFGYNNQDWLLTGGSISQSVNLVTGTINTTAGEIFGMNKFVYLKEKALLQGAYAGGGLMNDNLRTATGGNVIPLTPFNSIPSNNFFTQVNNNVVPEVVDPSVFANQANANDNIVDWVFVEVRNATPAGSSILQTRSALLQKDGDIVDLDGKSKLYFPNLNPTSYSVTIRHRNHLAISNNSSGGRYRSLNNLNNIADLNATIPMTTVQPTDVLGTQNVNYLRTTDGYNMMYAGNANGIHGSNRVSYSGSANDASYILGPILGGSVGGVIGLTNGVYHWADVNMDGRVSFSASNNDASYILGTVLGGVPSAIKTEIKPN